MAWTSICSFCNDGPSEQNVCEKVRHFFDVAWRGVAWRSVAWHGVAWRGVVSFAKRRGTFSLFYSFFGNEEDLEKTKPFLVFLSGLLAM